MKIILARFGGVRFSDFKQGNQPSETKTKSSDKMKNIKRTARLNELKAALRAAILEKYAANDALDAPAFNAAIVRIQDINFQIEDLERPTFQGCDVRRNLVLHNID